jgi:hypothetical protein
MKAPAEGLRNSRTPDSQIVDNGQDNKVGRVGRIREEVSVMWSLTCLSKKFGGLRKEPASSLILKTNSQLYASPQDTLSIPSSSLISG